MQRWEGETFLSLCLGQLAAHLTACTLTFESLEASWKPRNGWQGALWGIKPIYTALLQGWAHHPEPQGNWRRTESAWYPLKVGLFLECIVSKMELSPINIQSAHPVFPPNHLWNLLLSVSTNHSLIPAAIIPLQVSRIWVTAVSLSLISVPLCPLYWFSHDPL